MKMVKNQSIRNTDLKTIKPVNKENETDAKKTADCRAFYDVGKIHKSGVPPHSLVDIKPMEHGHFDQEYPGICLKNLHPKFC